MRLKAYSYLLKQTRGFPCLFTIIKEDCNLLLRRKCSLKVRFKKVCVVKSPFSDDLQF